MRYSFFIPLFCFIFFAFTSYQPIETISIDLTAKTLSKGKSITATGALYYQASGGKMVTRFITPVEYLVMTNAKGEMKMYYPKENSVTQNSSRDFSSENSFVYYFLNGMKQDMGLRKMGFELKSTQTENTLVITNWIPKGPINSEFTKAELVHENYLPVYLSFYDSKNKVAQKTYYSHYQKVADINMPMVITEIEYFKKDSVITKRTYSNIKLNEQVDKSWLDFTIPANAKALNK